MGLAGSHDQFDRGRSDFFRAGDERLRLLKRYDFVRVAVNDQRRRQFRSEMINGRDLPTQLLLFPLRQRL